MIEGGYESPALDLEITKVHLQPPSNFMQPTKRFGAWARTIVQFENRLFHYLHDANAYIVIGPRRHIGVADKVLTDQNGSIDLCASSSNQGLRQGGLSVWLKPAVGNRRWCCQQPRQGVPPAGAVGPRS